MKRWEAVKAFDEGKKVQFKNGTLWGDCVAAGGNIWPLDATYRLKPEPKYRPYKDYELIEMLRGSTYDRIAIKGAYRNCYIIGFHFTDCVLMSETTIGNSYCAQALLNEFTHADGRPFGVLEEGDD